MRITDSMVSRQVLRDLNKNANDILQTQSQLASGKEILKPSDNPAGIVSMLSFRQEIAELEQYEKNMDNSIEWMESSSNAMQRIEDIMFEITDSARQGETDLMTPEQRQTMSSLVDQYLNELVDLSNSTNRGRTLFGGTETGTEAFLASRDPVTGQIDSVTQNPKGIDGDLYRELGTNQRLKVNVNGDDLFQPGGSGDPTTDTFQMVINLRDALDSGDTTAIETQVDLLEGAQERVVERNSVIGASIERVKFSKDRVATEVLDKTERLSDVEDTDYPKKILEYYAKQNMYDTALSVGAQLIQSSIVNYL